MVLGRERVVLILDDTEGGWGSSKQAGPHTTLQAWLGRVQGCLGRAAAPALSSPRAPLLLPRAPKTAGVWPRHRENLVAPERYLYFPADAARFGFK